MSNYSFAFSIFLEHTLVNKESSNLFLASIQNIETTTLLSNLNYFLTPDLTSVLHRDLHLPSPGCWACCCLDLRKGNNILSISLFTLASNIILVWRKVQFKAEVQHFSNINPKCSLKRNIALRPILVK